LSSEKCADLYCFSQRQQELDRSADSSDIPDKYIQIRRTAVSNGLPLWSTGKERKVTSHGILSPLTAARYWHSVVGRFHLLSCITRMAEFSRTFRTPRTTRTPRFHPVCVWKNDRRLSSLSITCPVCHSWGPHLGRSQNNFTVVEAFHCYCLVSEPGESNWCLTESENISPETTRCLFFIVFKENVLFLVRCVTECNLRSFFFGWHKKAIKISKEASFISSYIFDNNFQRCHYFDYSYYYFLYRLLFCFYITFTLK